MQTQAGQTTEGRRCGLSLVRKTSTFPDTSWKPTSTTMVVRMTS